MKYAHTIPKFRAHLNTLYGEQEILRRWPHLIRNGYCKVLAKGGRYGHLLRLGDPDEFDRMRARWDGKPKEAAK